MESDLPPEQIQLEEPEEMQYESQHTVFSRKVSDPVWLNIYEAPGSVLVAEDVKMNVFHQGAHVYAEE